MNDDANAKYRILRPEEIIAPGDEFWTGNSENGNRGHWHPCKTSVGSPARLMVGEKPEVRRLVVLDGRPVFQPA